MHMAASGWHSRLGFRHRLLLTAMAIYVFAGTSSETKHLVQAELQYGFYSTTCPNAENIARATLMSSLVRDPTAPSALLRLAFHDCIVQGCDASILLQSGPDVSSELLSDRNFGIKRLDFIDDIKGALETACPATVSCADIIAMAARDSVLLSAGPMIRIPLGRRDGTSASNRRADSSIPAASSGLATALGIARTMGMTLEEGVAILGAHTLGVGHCLSVAQRLQDPQLRSTVFGVQLRTSCPRNVPVNNNTVITNDFTQGIFDNQYFRDLMLGRGLFTVDAQLASDSRTASIVRQFALNSPLFFQRFSSAFVKMTSVGVLTGGRGQIRTNCKAVN